MHNQSWCRRAIVLALFALLVPGEAVQSQEMPEDSLIEKSPRYTVRLPRGYRNPVNTMDTVGVTLTATDGDIAGFDLKIASDAGGMAIVDVLPGELADSCGWEYFAARDLGGAVGDEAIRSLWKVVGLAKASPDTTRPGCGHVEGEVTAARLVLDYRGGASERDTIAGLFFYWETCSDNSLTGREGILMAISNQVHDYLQPVQSRAPGVFPSRTGAPSQCVKLSAPNHPRRLVDFHNGGITLLLPPDSASADTLTRPE